MNKYSTHTQFLDIWISKIPAHWQAHKMKHLFSERSEKGYPNEPLLVASQNMGVVPKNVYGNRTVEAQKDLHLLKLVRVGDFVISLRSFQGGLEYAYYQGIISPAYTILIPHEPMSGSYFRYLAKSKPFIGLLTLCVTGIREGQNIDYAKLKNHLLPVPPHEEQDQIVRFLDWKVSSINKLINIRHKEISELNESLNTKLRDVLLSVPNVKEVPLKRICSIPMTDGPHETPTFVDSGIPFVSAEASHDGRIHLDECRGFITREQHEVYCQKVRPHKNDIFIVKSGSTTGKTVMVDFDEEFSIWSPLALVRCNNLAMPRYVFFYCTSVMFQKQVRDNWSFGTQPNIGMGVLENLRLPLPEIEEQRAIVDTLDAYWSKVLQVKCNLKKQIEELQSLKTRIIADTVTGKIDVRGIEIPEYEFVDEDIDNADENLEQGAVEPPEEE